MSQEYKWQRRDRKLAKRTKMQVDNKSIFLLAELAENRISKGLKKADRKFRIQKRK